MTTQWSTCLGSLIAVTIVSAHTLANPIYDAINSPLGGSSNATVGYAWQRPAPPPGYTRPPANQYDKIELKPEPQQNKPIIYSGLPATGSESQYQPAPKQPAFNLVESTMLNAGYNVNKLRALSADELQSIVDFRDTYKGITGGRTPALLKSLRENKGLIAFPDDTVADVAKRLRDSKRQGNQQLLAQPTDMIPLKRLADYLTVNQELFLIREQVLDPDRAKSLNDVREIIRIRGGYDLKDTPTRYRVNALKSAWGLQRDPTRDEVRGLFYWGNYFKGRESPENVVRLNDGQTYFGGERTVAGYLDTVEVRYAADLLRYAGTNNAPPALDPQFVDAEQKKGPVEQMTDPVHDWRDAAPSVFDVRRAEFEKIRIDRDKVKSEGPK